MLKIKYDNQIHIFRLASISPTVQGLRDLVKNTFKKYPPHFSFVFIDEEKDEIEVKNNEDLTNVIELAKMNQAAKIADMVKLTIKEEKVKQQSETLQSREFCNENYFEVMQEESESEYEQLRSCEQSEVIEIIAEDQQSLGESEVITELISQNMAKIEKQCVQKILEQAQEELLKSEVQIYLTNLQDRIIEYSKIGQAQTKIGVNQLKKKRKDLVQSKEVAIMIERSLQKLLPSFIQRLSNKTAETVKEILAKQ